ncbi:MAG: hypothetical protein MJE66_17755 [Proteobacteria bacterium]|nr:hypothetical protein [Pseudomonadota bacterium]
MTLEVHYDFSGWARANAEAGRGPLTPVIDPGRVSIEPGRFFSVLGRDAEGRLSHLQCARIVDLEAPNLGEHLITRRDLYCSPGLGIDPWSSRVKSRVAGRLNGRAVYHGDLWIAPHWRQSDLAPRTVLFLMMEALRSWSPDFLFGFTLPVTSNRSFAQKIGYRDCELDALAWHRGDGSWVRNEGFVWVERKTLMAHAKSRYGFPVDRSEARPFGERTVVG